MPSTLTKEGRGYLNVKPVRRLLLAGDNSVEHFKYSFLFELLLIAQPGNRKLEYIDIFGPIFAKTEFTL